MSTIVWSATGVAQARQRLHAASREQDAAMTLVARLASSPASLGEAAVALDRLVHAATMLAARVDRSVEATHARLSATGRHVDDVDRWPLLARTRAVTVGSSPSGR